MSIQKIQREESILLSLKMLDYLSRDQLQRLHNLKGDRNARRVMGKMSEYISNFRCENGNKIYYLNKSGRDRVGCDIARQKITQVNHYLMRNDYYIYLKPREWRNEVKFSVPDTVTVIPDAYITHNHTLYFLEIDHIQKMIKNQDKIERYKKIKELGVFQKQYKQFPKLIWVTLTENRRKQLNKWCEGLETKVFLWHEIK